VGRGYLVVEGRGEVKAVQNLIVRLWNDLGCNPCSRADPIRGQNLLRQDGVARACSIVRSKPEAEMLLILRDADDDCPASSGPTSAQRVREENLPFPTAVVLFHREYETLFLPCLARMAGVLLRDDRNIPRPGLVAGTTFEGNYEATRGVKEWLSERFPRGRNYKPTLDQLPYDTVDRLWRPPNIGSALVRHLGACPSVLGRQSWVLTRLPGRTNDLGGRVIHCVLNRSNPK